MKTAIFAAFFVCAGALVTSSAAVAGPIERACMSSSRQASSRALCGCIQQVADVTLSGSDQRRAAKFFTDPDAAQKAKALDSRSAEAFWERYANFGAAAEMHCTG